MKGVCSDFRWYILSTRHEQYKTLCFFSHRNYRQCENKGKPDKACPAVDIMNIPTCFQNSDQIFWTNDQQTVTIPPG